MMLLGVGGLARRVVVGLVAMLAIGVVSAQATPYLVVDADSGQVLIENEATAQSGIRRRSPS